ncbi:MarR family winged helix-turn-helix transcriptional regulator [Lachnoclostridium sp.]|uniref:MarR family winged helix-turn-helix transcriptional regulator n=1 Tax=Lachnoclostridium sp. TaxID=2028282 RepID=UPI00289BEC74|nr:MarR family transcriptional regulator [Lachnoclostridium sp.]
MIDQGSGTLRKLIRVLVKNLGMLEKSDSSCCGVTVTQCHAIVEIGQKGKVSLVDLADLLDVDKSTMSRTVNNLVELGLAIRELDTENRRFVIIQLTEDGKNVFNSIEKSMETYYKDIFCSIPEDKRGQVLESLALLTDAAKNNKCC